MGVMLLVGTAKGMFILEAEDKRARWSSRGPFHKGWMVYGLLADKRHSNPVMYAGVSSFIYGPHIQRSTDGGETWIAIENGPKFTKESGRKLEHIWSSAPGPKPKTLYAPWLSVVDLGLGDAVDEARGERDQGRQEPQAPPQRPR